MKLILVFLIIINLSSCVSKDKQVNPTTAPEVKNESSTVSSEAPTKKLLVDEIRSDFFKEYSSNRRRDFTEEQKVIVNNSIQEYFDSMRKARESHRQTFLEEWRSAEKEFVKEWEENEKKILELEGKVVAEDVENNGKLYAEMEKVVQESRMNLEKKVYVRLRNIYNYSSVEQIKKAKELLHKINSIGTYEKR